ncbi:MAG: hypothetical protein WDZ45_11705 [Flavobacteriaceae bacterium]
MKRLSTFLTLCLLGIIFTSCLNADNRNLSTEETNHISADELMNEINAADMHTTPHLNNQDTSKKKETVRLNNSTFQEMLVVYSHLDMTEDQIVLFENQFNSEVKNPNQKYRTQLEIQEILNASFQTVLSEDQFGRYNQWRTTVDQ